MSPLFFRVVAIAALSSVLSLSPSSAQAQIIPDATLGNEASVRVPNVTVGDDLADLIEGGATREPNLFHSFSDFNVLAGQRVYFANPAGIESVLSRVTGGNPSLLFGTLGVNGPADLFLINPNGIVFGPDVALDVSGSFYGTTADAVELGGGVFSAVAPEQSELLAVSPSVSFWNYLTPQSGEIQNRGRISAGENLTLAGGQLDLEGQIGAVGDLSLLAADEVQIRDTVAEPFVALAGGDLLVQGNEAVDIVGLSHGDSGLFSYGDMVLRSAEQVGGNAHYWSGGGFRVERLNGDSGMLSSSFAPIAIRALGNVEIENYEGNSLYILSGGSVQIGAATVIASTWMPVGLDVFQDSIQLSDGTILQVKRGSEPTLDIRAGTLPQSIGTIPRDLFFDSSFTETVTSSLEPFEDVTNADISVGDIFLGSSGLVLLSNQYYPNPKIEAENISLISRLALSNTANGGIIAGTIRGRAGDVVFDSRDNIDITDSLILTISTEGSGGNITLLARDSVRFNSLDNRLSGIFTGTGPQSNSPGGDIQITAAQLSLQNGSQISTANSGAAGSGDILIEVGQDISLSGVNSFLGLRTSITSTTSQGEGGDILLSSGNLAVTSGAAIDSSSIGIGNAGDILIRAAGQVELVGETNTVLIPSYISSSTSENSVGDAGDLSVLTSRLRIYNGAQIAAAALGVGNAGNLVINAADLVEIDGGLATDTGLFTQVGGRVNTLAEGEVGDLIIDTEALILRNGGQINATVFGIGRGNNSELTIHASDIYLIGTTELPGRTGIQPSAIQTRIEPLGQGEGANIVIHTERLRIENGARIASDIEQGGVGEAGDILILASDSIEIVGVSSENLMPSLITSSVNNDATGNAGNLTIEAGQLSILDGAQILAASLGIGDAGNVDLDIAGKILASNGIIATNSESSAGGQININARNIFLLGDSDIQTFVRSGQDSGGNIIISSDVLVALGDSDILAFSADGRGGNVDLSQTAFFGESFEFAPPGTDPRTLDGNDRVDINATGRIASGQISLADVSFIQNTLNELPDTLVNPDVLVSNSCIARNNNIPAAP